MKKLRLKTTTHTWSFGAGLGLGVGIAFPLAAPVFGAVIPDSTATLWGSALGAMVAIAGAFWVAGSAQRSAQKTAASLVLALIEPLSFALGELQDAYGLPTTRKRGQQDSEQAALSLQDLSDVRAAVAFVTDRHRVITANRNRIDAILPSLGPVGVSALFNLEMEMEPTMDVVRLVLSEADRPETRLYGAHASHNLRFALKVHREHIDGYIAALRLHAVPADPTE
jgi:hypothetical protein